MEIKTYHDIYEIIMSGKTVILYNRWGNSNTYFKNSRDKTRQRFNKCADSCFGDFDTSIDFLDTIEIEIKGE